MLLVKLDFKMVMELTNFLIRKSNLDGHRMDSTGTLLRLVITLVEIIKMHLISMCGIEALMRQVQRHQNMCLQ